MAIYIDNQKRIKDIFINVNGQKKRIESVFTNKNGVPAKVFSRNKNNINVTWTDGSYEEIAALLDMHYAGEIDISNYWHIGDKRVVHLSSMPSWNDTYGEAQPSQDVTLVIIGFNFDTLQTPINGISKSAITVHLRYTLSTYGVIDADYIEKEKNFNSVTLEWVACDRRKWCNNTFKNSLPSELSSLIKVVKKSNYYVKFSGSPSREIFYRIDDNFKAPNYVYDSCFLLSKNEVGLIGSSDPTDPTYPYFNDSQNRSKDYRWWIRQPSFGGEENTFLSWADIYTTNNGAQFIKNEGGIAPAFCL